MRVGSGMTYSSYRQLGFDDFDQPIFVFLAKFGRLIPEPARDLSGMSEMITASNICFSVLDQIAGFKIQWVNSLSLHLEFDNIKRILKIFRFPSFCMLMYREGNLLSK
jgi:hypothetical protein